MDLNLVDAGQQLGCGYRIFRAAKAGAVKRFIFVRVVIDITSSRAQHTEGCLARKVQRQNRRCHTHADERDGPAGELFLLAGLRRLRRSEHNAGCGRSRKVPRFRRFRFRLVLVQL